MTTIRFTHFPMTKKPPDIVYDIWKTFQNHEQHIATLKGNRKNSDDVLEILRKDLENIGFEVEQGKKSKEKIHRPVTYGENGIPNLKYEIDAYCPMECVGLEVEAGRGWNGNALYRDLIQGMVMNGIDHLVIALLNSYYSTGGDDYTRALKVCEALTNQRRFKLPYTITIIGY